MHGSYPCLVGAENSLGGRTYVLGVVLGPSLRVVVSVHMLRLEARAHVVLELLGLGRACFFADFDNLAQYNLVIKLAAQDQVRTRHQPYRCRKRCE